MGKIFHYAHGLPFTETVAYNLDDQLKRVKLNKASMIIIEGGVGSGKTTLAVHCGDYLMGAYERVAPGKYIHHPEKQMNFKKQLGMGGGQFMGCLKICFKEGLVVAIYDEAGDFSKRASLSQFNNLMNRVFDTYRAFKVIVIVCLPSFNYLDNALLDKEIPRLLMRCYDRNENNGNILAFDLLTMFILKHYMKKIPAPPQAYGLVEPNFHASFLDLLPERSRELDKFSTAGKIDILEMAEVKFEGLICYTDIAARLNRSIVWVRLKAKEFNIKHVKVFKKVKYFNKDVMQLFINAMDMEQIKQEMREEDDS